jgi:menaquinone-dependent protoporphyrinogen oxidase
MSAIPSLFFSVSLSAGSKRPTEVAAAQGLADKFATDTGWRPSRIACVAGRLAYSQYNWLVRLLMRRIARKEGGSTDTRQDHEYTNWDQVEQLANELAYAVRRREILPGYAGFAQNAASEVRNRSDVAVLSAAD